VGWISDGLGCNMTAFPTVFDVHFDKDYQTIREDHVHLMFTHYTLKGMPRIKHTARLVTECFDEHEVEYLSWPINIF